MHDFSSKVKTMAKENDITLAASQQLQPLEHIENLILVIRGRQVMLDRDLARLYGVETKRLNQQVRRNLERFPEDFMFQLTKEEAEVSRTQFATLDNDYTNLRSQNATSNEDSSRSQFATLNGRGQNIKYLPYAFTENGIAMLSSVLRSPMAIATNIQIMRAFTAMRHFIASNAQVFQRLEIMERNQLALNAHQEEISSHLAENDKKFEEVFRRLDDGSVQPTQRIFYDGEIFDAYIFINERIREAKKRIVLFDNYVDDSVLKMFDKRAKGVTAKIYTKYFTPELALDLKKHNAQYAPIDVEQFNRAHDRFLCIDDTVYFIGASLKDLGKKWFAFGKMDVMTTNELLSKI